jgi:uncharacterized membrane protein YcaP (DUF421 family)
MLEAVAREIQAFLGYNRDVGDVNALQMALRTVLIYVVTLVLIRLGSKRFLSQASAFDVIVGIMLGSVMSRAINSSAPLFPTLLAGVVFIGLHWSFAALAFHTHWFGSLVKGSPTLLVKDGELQQEGARRTSISSHDLKQALRLQAQETDLEKIRLAYLERDGAISIIPNKAEPRVVDVAVADGVQTVRIELR